MATAGRSTQVSEKERAEALAQMDLVKIGRAYLSAMIDEAGSYKGLLMDKETIRVCSMLYGRGELADHNVVFPERIDTNDGKEHPELKAICFLRPTRDNINVLKRELRNPRYQEYHIFFSNLLSTTYLQDIAEADAPRELVRQVQEFYGDFCVLDPHHFSIPVPNNELLIAPRPGAAVEYEIVDRLVQGLSALFLAVRRRPVIRYQRGAEHAQKLAESLYQLTYKQQYQIFDFGARSNPIVLILDRRDDPVTPLLMQWTYQAMVHELIGLDDNKITLTSLKVPPEARELVLDARQDDFYRRHMLLNYGDVGLSVKQLVEKFQASSEQHSKVESLEDMRRFVAQHADFQKLQANVSKHVNIMSEMSEAISKRSLMEVSMSEQEVASNTAGLTAAASYEDIVRLLRLPPSSVADKDKVRLVMLFALRFEQDVPRIRGLLDQLVQAGVREREPRLFQAVDCVLRYGGAARRAGDLYGGGSLMSKARTMLKGAMQGVDNVYTQHSPLLASTLNLLAGDRLDPGAYPFMAGSQDEALAYQAAFKRSPPREVIVFVVGGSTYEEARCVAEWNERNPHMRVILGGSAVLNSAAFMAALTAAVAPDGASGGSGGLGGAGALGIEVRR